uniref:CCHC-type domain-containing protein n=1 Tax=Strongyloides stercoralis TaxID=6248 RepID=A0A0K0EBX3_STRER
MAEQLANLNNKPSLIAACQQSGLQTTGRKIDLARRLIESGIDLSNITYLILSLESISEEDLNLSYVPEDNRSPEANDNSEIPPHREEEYGNGMRSRTLDLTMFKQLPEFKKGSDPEIFKDNFMRCMILSGLQIGDPRAAMWLLLRVEDTIQRRLKDTFPNIDNESAATLLGTLVRWYGKKMKAEEAENQLLTFEIRMEQIKTNEEFKKKLQWLRELIEAKYYDLSMERKNEMYKFEIIKLFRGIGHLKGLSEYGMSYKIPMLETEALRINEDFQRNRLRRMATTTTTFQGSCYNCGKMGHRGYQCKENTTKTDIKGKNSIKTMLVKESEAEEVQQLLDLIRMNDENSDSTEDYDKMLNIYETTNVESLKKTEDDDILEIKIKRKNDEQGEIHKMLADTRSNRNILSESALIKLIKNKKNKINKSDIKIKKTFLKGLGDATITSHAYITVDLEFKGHTTSTDILILKDKDILTTGDYDGIISKKTLKELGMKLTFIPTNKTITKDTKDNEKEQVQSYDSNKNKTQKDTLLDITLPEIILLATPPRAARYPVPIEYIPQVHQQIRTWEEQGVVRKELFPQTVMSLVCTRKSNGGVRTCLDCRAINQVIPHYDIAPENITLNIHKLRDSEIFSVLDLKEYFTQLTLNKNNRKLLGFQDPKTKITYSFQKLPFGLRHASAMGQTVLNRILAKHTNTIAYIDDIICFSKNPTDHIKEVEDVKQTLAQYNLFTNESKCLYNVKKIEYLGYFISHNTIQPSPKKTEAINSITLPKRVIDIKNFLGQANYFRRWLDNIAEVEIPLIKLTTGSVKKYDKVNLGEEETKAFEEIKKKLIKAQLMIPKRGETYYLFCDSSGLAHAACLAQKDENKTMRAVAYFSKRKVVLKKTEPALYSEARGIILALDYFRTWILGAKIVLLSDHKPLIGLINTKEPPNNKMALWLERIMHYAPIAQFIKGTDNMLADYYSRPTVNICKQDTTIINKKMLDTKETQKDSDNTHNNFNWIIKSSNYKKEAEKLFHHLHEQGIHQNYGKILSWISTKYHKEKVDVKKLAIILKHLKLMIQNCKVCNETNTLTRIKRKTKEIPQPGQHLSIDYCGPFAVKGGNVYVLVILDDLSSFACFFTTKKMTKEATIKILNKKWFACYGIPEMIHADNAKAFIAMEQEMKLLGIQMSYALPGEHLTNSKCERAIRSLRLALEKRKFDKQKNDFEDELAIISTYMNCMPRSSTNITPAEVMLHSKMKPYGNNQLEIIKKIGDEWELDELVNNDHIETLRLLKKLKNNRQKEIGMEELPTSNYVWQRKLNRNKRKLEGPNQIRKLKKDKDGLVCIDIKGADDGRTKRKFNALKYRNVLQKT